MQQRIVCPHCGDTVPYGYRFCGKCGADLGGEINSTSYQQMNWFKRHLNWTYFIGILIVVVVAYATMAILGVIGAIIGLVILIGGFLGLACWVLYQKGRSLAWVLFFWIWFIPLILNNKKGNRPQ